MLTFSHLLKWILRAKLTKKCQVLLVTKLQKKPLKLERIMILAKTAELEQECIFCITKKSANIAEHIIICI